ncbi:hypothetical protein [Legionella sp. W05-934-2]|uniref:hypothetical protein n=1 Tax=Legionella sp. W05-934-2 TaxID=1198649 RepID=UPI003462174B
MSDLLRIVDQSYAMANNQLQLALDCILSDKFIEQYQKEVKAQLERAILKAFEPQSKAINIAKVKAKLSKFRDLTKEQVENLETDYFVQNSIQYFSKVSDAVNFYKCYLSSMNINNRKALREFALTKSPSSPAILGSAVDEANRLLSIGYVFDIFSLYSGDYFDERAQLILNGIAQELSDYLIKILADNCPFLELYIKRQLLLDSNAFLKSTLTNVKKSFSIHPIINEIEQRIDGNVKKLQIIQQDTRLKAQMDLNTARYVQDAMKMTYLLNGKETVTRPYARLWRNGYPVELVKSFELIQVNEPPKTVISNLAKLIMSYCDESAVDVLVTGLINKTQSDFETLALELGLEARESVLEKFTGEKRAYVNAVNRTRDGQISRHRFFNKIPSEDELNIKWLIDIYPESKDLLVQYYPQFNPVLKMEITSFRHRPGFAGFQKVSQLEGHPMDKDLLCAITLGLPQIPVCVMGGNQVYDLEALIKNYQLKGKDPINGIYYTISDITKNNHATQEYDGLLAKSPASEEALVHI